MHRRRRRRVLDQLHQVIPEHHLARRRRHVPADDEALGADRRLARELPLEILQPVSPAFDEVGAPGLTRAGDHLRVRPGAVRGGEDVEDLPGDERNDLLVMTLHARHVVGDVVPPLLVQQKSLGEEAEGL